MSSKQRFESVSLDDLADRLGFTPSYLMPWDLDEDSVADASDPDPFSPEQHALAEALLASGITAAHVRSGFLESHTLADLVGTGIISPKENVMQDQSTPVVESEHQYDSGILDPEHTPLAVQIEQVGIEVVTAAIVAAKEGSSVADDNTRANVFDPDAYGFIPVFDVFTDEEIDDVVVTLCQKTKGGEPNPLYVTQQWLDPVEGFERLYVARMPASGDEHLGQPVIIYTQQVEDDITGFVQNLPIAFTKALTVKAARDFISQFRPAPSPEEVERVAGNRESVADKIRRLQNTQF